MPGPFRSREALLLLVVGAIALGGGVYATGVGGTWTAVAVVVWTLVVFPRLGVRLQDALLERALSRADYDNALRLSVAMRNGAFNPTLRELAAFDVGLVHLARGAPVDAERVFSRIDRRRLKEKTRLLVGTYHALSRVRALEEGEARHQAARDLAGVCAEAIEQIGEDANFLAAGAEARLALGELPAAREQIDRSLALDDDPGDPSPGERHLLLGRIAQAQGDRATALAAWKTAASLGGTSPCVRAAEESLSALEGAA